jgi:transcriptional regulator with XRE-family HTH domain
VEVFAMDMREFGVRLSQFRKRSRLSTSQLAQSAGVTYMSISRYEKGENLPSLQVALVLARVLKISLDELTGTEPPRPLLFQNEKLFQRMRDLDRLPMERQEMALRVVDTVIAGYELEDLSRRLKGS